MEQQVLDIETGMAVYGGNGQIIGTVSETADFGSSRPQPAAHSAGGPVPPAQSGIGYVNVACHGRKDLRVPFHGIEQVISRRGVYLTTSMVDELRRGINSPHQQADVVAVPQQRDRCLGRRRRKLGPPRRWRLWRPLPWPAWGQSEAREAPVDVDRREP